MSRTYKDRRKKETKGNPYPDRKEQLGIKHAVGDFDVMKGDLQLIIARVKNHREMCGGNQYNNMCRLERELRSAVKRVDDIHKSLADTAHWLKYSKGKKGE